MDFKTVSSSFREVLSKQYHQESHFRFTLGLGLFIALLLSLFMVGTSDLNYNTLFLDEAINVVVGQDLLHGIYTRNAIAFHFGSYLYPALSAILNEIGGITALRWLSVVMMCLASVFTYFTTRRLFGRNAGLFSMMLFSFSSVVLNLGQLAVYDSLALPFLAVALFFLTAATTSDHRQEPLLFAASICAIFSTLSKYIGFIYLPALCITGLAILSLRGIPFRRALFTLFIYFILPTLLFLSFYAALYWQELIQVFKGQNFSPGSQRLILNIIGQEIGLILFLALIGGLFLITALTNQRNYSPLLSFWNKYPQNAWNMPSRSARHLYFGLLVLLIGAWLAAPLQHLIAGNIRSLWKHCSYSLVFLTPLAGYCIASVMEFLRTRGLSKNFIGVVCLCLSVVYFADKALDSNWLFHRSWPNTEAVVTYLRESGLNKDSRVLAEGMDIYEYYFDFGTNDRQVWNNFWYMEYGAKSGQEGAFAAIHDRALDFVIIDDYYFPGLRERVNPVLAESGYVVGWQEAQKLRSGETILIQVFVPGEGISK